MRRSPSLPWFIQQPAAEAYAALQGLAARPSRRRLCPAAQRGLERCITVREAQRRGVMAWLQRRR